MTKNIHNLETYFKDQWETTETDSHVVDLVKKSNAILDVGCGFNQYKKYNENLVGVDPYNSNSDQMIDILDFETDIKYDLIICYGSINFYNLKWVDDRMYKIFSLLAPKGTISMKVNPNKPFANGIKLQWYDRWTTGLMNHYGEIFNCSIDNFREANQSRFKWDYVTR